ncbi:MAG: hypothetical protein ACRDJG_04690 [Actinomycetota bacterium]
MVFREASSSGPSGGEEETGDLMRGEDPLVVEIEQDMDVSWLNPGDEAENSKVALESGSGVAKGSLGLAVLRFEASVMRQV